jgi:hypothetical protein
MLRNKKIKKNSITSGAVCIVSDEGHDSSMLVYATKHVDNDLITITIETKMGEHLFSFNLIEEKAAYLATVISEFTR